MNEQVVYLNGQFVPLSQANVSVLDRGFIFGDGIYDVIPVYQREMFRPMQHLERLTRSLASVGLDNIYSNEQWRILANLGYQKIFNSVPTYKVYIESEMELLGRFSIERNITMNHLNQILSYNSYTQKRLFVRQKASQFLHTLKHRIKGS